MLTKNLIEEVLVKPAKESADTLYIVSGYAGATMAYFHLERLKKIKSDLRIKLIVGMCAQDGIGKSNHLAFQRLVTKDYPKRFECRYLIKPPPVHSKIYTWTKNENPFVSFIGSANYTQNGFSDSQRESMAINDAEDGLSYFSGLYEDSVDCRKTGIERIIQIYDERYDAQKRKKPKTAELPEQQKKLEEKAALGELPSVTTSFLDRKGQLPRISGLNWGQRPKYHREPNQAYIKLPSDVYRSGFFPEVGRRFTILTDDGEVFVCSRAQQNGKAIHTPDDNSLLGKYFRKRLGVPLGSLVKLTDLLKYGRTSVDFYKIDDETYYLDFSSKGNG